MNASSRMPPASTSARGRQAEKIVGRLMMPKTIVYIPVGLMRYL